MNPSRIIQVSDCHVSADPSAIYRGIDPRAQLEALLPAVRDWRPDLLLLTGDLAEDGRAESYRYLASVLASFEVPLLTLPGNHDVAEVQRAVFSATPVSQPLHHDLGAWRLVLLNSAVPRKITGHFDAATLQALDAMLAEHEGPALVALHHQPLAVGSAWIDRYPLQSPDEFWTVVSRHPGVRIVTWGHVHQVFESQREGVCLLSAPSSALNGQRDAARFTPDGLGPGARWYELHPDGRFESGVLRAD